MSKELENRIDDVRDRLITDARTPISMSNGRQKLRTAQEMFLEFIDITKAINADDDVDDAKLDALAEQVKKLVAESEGAA